MTEKDFFKTFYNLDEDDLNKNKRVIKMFLLKILS